MIGAIWAPFGLVALGLLVTADRVTVDEEAGEVTVVSATSVTGETVTTVDATPDHEREVVDQGGQWPLWQQVLAFTILPLGVLAPFVCTTLGCLGISRIRNSRGRLIGMPLAVPVALLYPLLILDGVLLLIGMQLGDGSEYWRICLGVTALIVLATDFYLIRAAWRAASRPANTSAPI